MDVKLYNIVGIVNEGYSDLVMEIAKDCGARGGTIIPANGSVTAEATKLYGIGIHPEKEIVLLVVPFEIKDQLLHALYKDIGIQTPAQGIVFTVPVDETAGIGKKSAANEKAEEVSYEEYNKALAEAKAKEENRESTNE